MLTEAASSKILQSSTTPNEVKLILVSVADDTEPVVLEYSLSPYFHKTYCRYVRLLVRV